MDQACALKCCCSVIRRKAQQELVNVGGKVTAITGRGNQAALASCTLIPASASHLSCSSQRPGSTRNDKRSSRPGCGSTPSAGAGPVPAAHRQAAGGVTPAGESGVPPARRSGARLLVFGNVLSFKLAGDGELDLSLVVKEPGPDLTLSTAHTALPVRTVPGGHPLPPYVRLIHDVLLGDRSLFTVHTAWNTSGRWPARCLPASPSR
jgi:Glucose-6-phosphate dehydrogenase, C-terminal domain